MSGLYGCCCFVLFCVVVRQCTEVGFAVYEIDEIDKRILQELQLDAGLTNQELSERVCLSPTPCARRVNILREKGFFCGKVTLIEPKAVGLAVVAFIQVTLEHQAKNKLEHFEEVVSSWPEVMECYLMTGDFDYLIRVIVSDLNAFKAFLEERLTATEGISGIKSSLAIKQVQYKTQLPLEHLGASAVTQ